MVGTGNDGSDPILARSELEKIEADLQEGKPLALL